MKPRKNASILSLTFFLFWSLLAVGISKYWFGAIPAIVFVILPISCVVGWRTYTLCKRNESTYKGFISDDSIWGGLVSLVYVIIQASKVLTSELTFKGEYILGASFFQFVLFNLVPVVIAGALLGAIHGLLAVALKRFFDKPANQSRHS